MIITIDGPAGTGKSTVAQKVAEQLHLPYFDTGAMYRSVTHMILEQKISLEDESSLNSLMSSFRFEIGGTACSKRYFVNGCDVTESIRSQAITKAVSQVSALPIVRQVLWRIQKSFAEKNGGVFDGRDMGSIVFPQADIKIFLTASAQVRAARRLEEIGRKNPREAELLSYEKVLQDLLKRDELDSNRSLAPLICPKGAYHIDCSNLTVDAVTSYILEYQTKKKLKPLWLHSKGVGLGYRCLHFFIWVYAKFFYKHKTYGLEHYYPKGAIIASNHLSYLDPLFLGLSWPEELHFLARSSLFKPFLFGRIIRALNAHPVSGSSSDIGAFRTACRLISKGKKIIIFPEGTRSLTGDLGPIKPGVSVLLERSSSVIIPAYLKGPYEVWGKNRTFPKIFGHTLCVFGSPIRWEAFSHMERHEAHEAIAKKVEESLLSLKRWVEAGSQGTPP